MEDHVEDQLSSAFDIDAQHNQPLHGPDGNPIHSDDERDAPVSCSPDPQGASSNLPPGWDPLPPDWTVLSQRHNLVMGPDGSIYPRKKAETQAEQEVQNAELAQWYVEQYGQTAEEDDWSVPGVGEQARQLRPPPGYRSGDDKPEEGQEDPAPVAMVGRKRRELPAVKCHYIGCAHEIDQVPLKCPSHRTGDPDLPYAFCSYECMMAWALYEIGDPVAVTLEKLINHRAGRKVAPGPTWYEMLISGVGKLKVTGAADAKGLRLEEDSSTATGSRTHEAQMLPDNATVDVDDIAAPMDDNDDNDDPLTWAVEVKLVPCRGCQARVASNAVAMYIRLHTAALYAFCSNTCAERHVYRERGAFISMVEFLDLGRKNLLYLYDTLRAQWGSEPDDVEIPDKLVRAYFHWYRGGSPAPGPTLGEVDPQMEPK